MISCMIIRHSSITNLTKFKLLRFLFYQANFEIHVAEKDTALIYIWHIQQTDLWQAVSILAVTDLEVGYGFGLNKREARKKADHVLRKWQKGRTLSTGSQT